MVHVTCSDAIRSRIRSGLIQSTTESDSCKFVQATPLRGRIASASRASGAIPCNLITRAATDTGVGAHGFASQLRTRAGARPVQLTRPRILRSNQLPSSIFRSV